MIETTQKLIIRRFPMGEMISSFDGTKLYFNREMPEQARATAVLLDL